MGTFRKYIGAALALALLGALGWHWADYFRARAGQDHAGVRLVVFGPSNWDTLVPGASAEVIAAAIGPIEDEFRRLHPEVGQIVHDSRGTVADGLARLRNAHVAGNAPDVVICAANPVNTSYARLGLIQPLDGLIAGVGDRFTPDAIDNFTVGGHVWGAPLSAVNISTFFYNRALFKRLKLEPPHDYAGFRALGVRLRAEHVIPIIHQGKNAWMWTPWYYSALVQTTGGRHRAFLQDVLAGRARFTDPASLQALALTRRWADEGTLDPGKELDEEGMKAAFLQGRAASFFGGTWDMAGVRENARFDWGVFPYPSLGGQSGRPRSFGGAEMALCLASGSRQPELAKAYIELVTRDANAKVLFAPLHPFATSHRAIAGVAGDADDRLRAQLPAEKPLEWMFPPEANEAMQRELQAMMAGAQSPAQTAATLQARFDALAVSGAIARQSL
jgi:raffinose/stachyose/melibiose transport system substrate-binding protein